MRLRVFIICLALVAAGTLKGAEELNGERVLSRRKRFDPFGFFTGLISNALDGLNLAESIKQTGIMEAELENSYVQTDIMAADLAQNLAIWKEQKRQTDRHLEETLGQEGEHHEETIEQEEKHHREVIRQNRILANETAAQMDALQKAKLAKIDEIYRKESTDHDRRNKDVVSELSEISGALNDIADTLRHQHLHPTFDFIESTVEQFLQPMHYGLPDSNAMVKLKVLINNIAVQEKMSGDVNYRKYPILLNKFVDLALEKTEDYRKIKKDYFMFSTFNQLITPLIEPFSCYPTIRHPTIPGAPISESARLELVSAYCSYDLHLTEISLKLAASCQNRKCINYYGEQDISECNVKTCDSELDLLNDKIAEMATQIAEIPKMAAQIAYLQERKGAFRYYRSSSSDMVKKGTVVSFDRSEYGSGVRNGVFTAQTAGWYEFTWHLLFNRYNNEGFGCSFNVRKNGSKIQWYMIDQYSANFAGHSFVIREKVQLGVGDTIDLYTYNSKRDYNANGAGTKGAYFEGRIIYTL